MNHIGHHQNFKYTCVLPDKDIFLSQFYNKKRMHKKKFKVVLNAIRTCYIIIIYAKRDYFAKLKHVEKKKLNVYKKNTGFVYKFYVSDGRL
jgi:hypothetical protein